MTVYVISAMLPNADLMGAIANAYPNDHYAFGNQTAYVATTDTVQTVCDRIGIQRRGADGSVAGQFVHVAVAQLSPTYWGFAPSALWDWLKRAFEKLP